VKPQSRNFQGFHQADPPLLLAPPGGAAKLDFGVTVLSDGAANSLTGAASVQALDWFFAGMGDKLHNVEAGEQINNI
jgi:hypothetical protein